MGNAIANTTYYILEESNGQEGLNLWLSGTLFVHGQWRWDLSLGRSMLLFYARSLLNLDQQESRRRQFPLAVRLV